MSFFNDNSNNNNDKPPNSFLESEVIDLNGQRIPKTKEGYITDENGHLVKETQTSRTICADGRIMPPDSFVAVSWTGLPIPADRLFSCLNPFGSHGFRPIYLEIDGFATELGNILCAECIEINENRAKWRKLLPFIYTAEVF